MLYTRAGPEIAVAAARTFTAQTAAFLAVVNIISDGKLKRPIAEIQRYLPEIVATDIDGAVSVFKDAQSLIYVGRGLRYPVALEEGLR